MRLAFTATDANTATGREPVWGQSQNPAAGPLIFGARLNVNTDGTRRSYSVDDPGGRIFALNNVCNAMAGYCQGLSASALAERFRVLRQARDEGWPANLLAQSRLSASVIPRRSDGRVCPEIEQGGRRYLVSSTALADPRAGDTCSIDRYVDALAVPALVLQGGSNGFTQRGVRVGDAVVAWRPGLTAPVFAVAGDTGPTDRLGEGSIALNGALLRRTGEPANYLQVRSEYVVPRAHVLVFPGTRDSARPRITRDRVEAAARDAFVSWGGGSEARAFARLQGCVAAMER
ncbi:hypothetical protein [Roseomonas sp. CECT 9278]|uniref:hypothetical protein n=1 Tax=Roseomonas sp. CECT 9278 TaxID=2845823 RepID=UPI001E5EC3A8|nr:hypothetical protein [Roseomonas sp. CECT 9278]